MGATPSKVHENPYYGYYPPQGYVPYGGYPQTGYPSAYSYSSKKMKKAQENYSPMYYMPLPYQMMPPGAYQAQYPITIPYPHPDVQLGHHNGQDHSTSTDSSNAEPPMPQPHPQPPADPDPDPVEVDVNAPGPMPRHPSPQMHGGGGGGRRSASPSGSHRSEHGVPFDTLRNNPLPEAPRPVEIPAHLVSGTAVTPGRVPVPQQHTRRPRLAHPLPAPPRDVYDTRLYRDLTQGRAVRSAHIETHPDGWGGRGSSLSRGLSQTMKKLSPGGLLRSFGSPQGGGSVRRRGTMPFESPAWYSARGGLPQSPMESAPPNFMSVPEPPQTPPPPVKFDRLTNNPGFLHVSPHKILYKKKLYPTALHLFEAFKFLGSRNDLAEHVRKTERVRDVYPLTAELQEYVRRDWPQISLEKMDEVLYLKFIQHPDLRALLMETGVADLIYSERTDPFWGDGPTGDGANELGRALMRVRDRLRREGAGR